MEHWFDGLAKGLASGTLARRSVLRLAIGPLVPHCLAISVELPGWPSRKREAVCVMSAAMAGANHYTLCRFHF